MKWKILLFVALVAILAYFFLFKGLSFPSLNLSSFPSITGFFFKPNFEGKQMFLTIYSFNSPISFSLLNSTSYIKGVCTTPITIDKLSLQLTNKPCEIEFYNPSGEFRLSGNVIYFSVNSPSFKINDVLYSGSGTITGALIIDNTFFSASLKDTEIKDFKGNLQIIFNNMPSLTINFPPCDYLKINNFFGSVFIQNSAIKISGIASLKYRCGNVENEI